MEKAVIFDVDGVLLDDIDLYVKAYKETARMMNLKEPSELQVKSALGMTREEMMKEIFVNVDEKLKEVHNNNIMKFLGNVPFMDGLEQFLKDLTCKKAIVSSKPKSDIDRQLRKITKFFDVIVSKEDSKIHKPNPEPIFLACKKLGIIPQDAIYVGDAVNDWKAANNAGMRFIGFTRGAATPAEFDELKARHVNSFKELQKELGF
jgi:pyrophosphatase PpaX